MEILGGAKVSVVAPTFTQPVDIDVSSTSPALTVTQRGTGAALLVEDTASVDPTPFVVNTSGQVGIGTASPAYSLDILSGDMRIKRAAQDAAAIYFGSDASTSLYGDVTNDVMAFTTNGTERVRINNIGHVGIGTTSPAVNLHVNADGASQSRVQRNSTDAIGPIVAFVKQRGTAAAPTVVAAGDIVGEIDFFAYDGASRVPAAVIQALVDTTPGTNDMPGRLSFLTSPDGTAIPVERMRIDNAGLITGTGSSLGAWTAYTPTLTNVTVGDGTLAAFFCRIGKVVYYRGRFTLGATSAITGIVDISYPATPVAYPTIARIGDTLCFDTSASTYYPGCGVFVSTSVLRLQVFNAAGTYASITNVNATVPFTFAAGDFFEFSGTYEAA